MWKDLHSNSPYVENRIILLKYKVLESCINFLNDKKKKWNSIISCYSIRAFTADVSNAKYLAHLAYQTSKKLHLWDVPNLIIFATCEQYRSIWMEWTRTLKKKFFIHFSLILFYFLSSLSFISFFISLPLLLLCLMIYYFNV